jgi:hypothetical protein
MTTPFDILLLVSYHQVSSQVFQEEECQIHNSGKQKIFKIKTKFGIIRCSPNHKWIVKRDGKIMEIETKSLYKTDRLLRLKWKTMLQELEILDIEETEEYIEMIDLEVKDNHNFFLENDILTHNSGKTFFLRSMGDRIYKSGRDLIYLSDVKNEFYTSKEPVQSKFHSGLLDGETPMGIPVVSLRPTFFKTVMTSKPTDNFWYSIDVNKLSKADFMTMMNVEELTATQRIAMDVIFEELMKKMDDGTRFSLEMVEEIIDEIKEMSSMQKNALKFKFRPLRDSKFIENDFERSIVALLQHPRRYVPAINMENFDSFGKGSFSFPEVILNVALREAILARRAGTIKPLWVIMDESSRFIGNRKQGSLKQNILESVDLDTRYHINYIFATQVIEDIPENILKQCKYIFIPATADVNTIKTVLVQTAMVKNQQVAPNRAMRLKQRMKKVKFSWVILNRMDGTMDLVTPLSPLSRHLETSQ